MYNDVAIRLRGVSKCYHLGSPVGEGIKHLILHLPSQIKSLRQRRCLVRGGGILYRHFLNMGIAYSEVVQDINSFCPGAGSTGWLNCAVFQHNDGVYPEH